MCEKEAELLAKVERVRLRMKQRIALLRSAREEDFEAKVMLNIFEEEFPDAKE